MEDEVFVIVPAYDEGPRIGQVVREIKTYCSNVVVVDDGSTDNTKSEAIAAGAIVVSHEFNTGKADAMISGGEIALNAGAKYLLFIDGDGQHNPNKIPEIIKEIRKGKDLVYGCRDLSHTPWDRKIGSNIIKWLLVILWQTHNPDPLSGFKIITSEAYKTILWNPEHRYMVESDIIINARKNRLKTSYVEIPQQHIIKPRGIKRSDGFRIIWNIIKRRFLWK